MHFDSEGTLSFQQSNFNRHHKWGSYRGSTPPLLIQIDNRISESHESADNLRISGQNITEIIPVARSQSNSRQQIMSGTGSQRSLIQSRETNSKQSIRHLSKQEVSSQFNLGSHRSRAINSQRSLFSQERPKESQPVNFFQSTHTNIEEVKSELSSSPVVQFKKGKQPTNIVMKSFINRPLEKVQQQLPAISPNILHSKGKRLTDVTSFAVNLNVSAKIEMTQKQFKIKKEHVKFGIKAPIAEESHQAWSNFMNTTQNMAMKRFSEGSQNAKTSEVMKQRFTKILSAYTTTFDSRKGRESLDRADNSSPMPGTILKMNPPASQSIVLPRLTQSPLTSQKAKVQVLRNSNDQRLEFMPPIGEEEELFASDANQIIKVRQSKTDSKEQLGRSGKNVRQLQGVRQNLGKLFNK